MHCHTKEDDLRDKVSGIHEFSKFQSYLTRYAYAKKISTMVQMNYRSQVNFDFLTIYISSAQYASLFSQKCLKHMGKQD